MAAVLLERAQDLAVLDEAVAAAAAGSGRTVLVAGEAGIGKTSLLREFCSRTPARVLHAACDDLMAPRVLGPVADAAAQSPGPLAAAIARHAGLEVVLPAFLAELAGPGPTVVVIEDVHWADDATFDVLLHAARRLHDLPAVLVLSYRDTVVDADHPLRRLLGALSGAAVRRIVVRPLSESAVRTLAAASGRDASALFAATAGNPFFVTESLAAAADDVAVTIVDAVLARCGALGPRCREALERISVVPSRVSFPLATELLGAAGLEALAEAERAGVLELRPDGLAFRHELARRVVEESLPKLRRRLLNQAVVTALLGQAEPDPARLAHHAVAAGDVATLLAVGPAAAREAAHAGSRRQALALFECVLPWLSKLGVREQAALLDDYGWELYNAHRFADAVRAGQEAVERYGELGDTGARGRCLARLSRHLFMAGETAGAVRTADRAVAELSGPGDAAYALLGRGAIPALTGDPEGAEPMLRRAHELAEEAGRTDLAALCLNYLGTVRAELGDPAGEHLLRRSVAQSVRGGHQEYAARGYTNLVELLFRLGDLDELERCAAEGLAYTQDRGFWSHSYNLELHRRLRMLRLGDWDAAEAGIRELTGAVRDPGMLFVYSAPWLGRLAARRGAADAGELLAECWDRARRQQLTIGWAYASIAYAEWAWLAGRPDVAEEVAERALPQLRQPGSAPFRAELLRYLARLGLAAPPFPGCPERYAAGLRGDHLRAAELAVDPYERALELADSGDPAALREALGVLTGLGAEPAVATVRARLRALGERVPRGPRRTVRANPHGLTDRQVSVLHLVGEGLTNAEIGERLCISARTVEHHLAAVFLALDVRSRRAAGAAARKLGVTGSPQPLG